MVRVIFAGSIRVTPRLCRRAGMAWHPESDQRQIPECSRQRPRLGEGQLVLSDRFA